MDCIKITNLKIFAHHGVFPEETRNGQYFYVNAKLYLDCKKAGKTDCLEDSLNYGEVSHFITDFLTSHTYKLLEAAAEHLVEEMLLSMHGLRKVELELCKPQAPIGLPFENVSVTIERGWHRAYLALGSNIGEKEKYLAYAVEELEKQRGIRNVRVSDFITTAPYGVTEQEDFLNGAVAIDTLFSLQELLELLQKIEAGAERKKELRWGPRTLDMDLIFYDKLVYEDDNLVIPHIDVEHRTFVLEPLAQLCPNYRHPILQKTVMQMLAELKGEDYHGF
ncbi:MAG: 2-amino-4-hydroxy-6-hydroxymethyldihydropteridine diphosphokinase [Roseburia sp.]